MLGVRVIRTDFGVKLLSQSREIKIPTQILVTAEVYLTKSIVFISKDYDFVITNDTNVKDKKKNNK